MLLKRSERPRVKAVLVNCIYSTVSKIAFLWYNFGAFDAIATSNDR